MSQLVKKSDKAYSVEQWLKDDAYQQRLRSLAPVGITPERYAGIAIQLWRESKSLQACTTESLLAAVQICVSTGLEPGPLGHAAIVPYKGVAQWQAMYRGLLHLVYRSEKVSACQAAVVYEKDDFDYNEGSSPHVHFKRALVADEDRGDRVAVFATIIPHTGPPLVKVMHISEIERIRKQYSKAKRSDAPWMTEYNQMACKTVIKPLAKISPISIETARAVSYDDLADVGKPQPVPDMDDLKDVTPEQQE